MEWGTVKVRRTKSEGRKRWRSSECGMRNWEARRSEARRQRPEARAATHEPRITVRQAHRRRKTSVAEQSHFVARPMPRRRSGMLGASSAQFGDWWASRRRTSSTPAGLACPRLLRTTQRPAIRAGNHSSACYARQGNDYSAKLQNQVTTEAYDE